MACAFFEPIDGLARTDWPGKCPPPLGRLYAGVCRAVPGEAPEPGGELLVWGCNLGYARARCKRIPEDAPDAVRVGLLPCGRVRWVLERDHHPDALGIAARSSPTGRGVVLDSQVEAYFRALEAEGGLFG